MTRLKQVELLVQKLERRLEERGRYKNPRMLFNGFINFLKNAVRMSIIGLANNIMKVHSTILVYLHMTVCIIHIILLNHGLVTLPQNMMVIY